MREEMRQLDELQMDDLWREASSRVPGPDLDPGPDRSTSSRVIAGVVAFVIVAVVFAIAVPVLRKADPSIPVAPDPASVCLSDSRADPSFVALDGVEVSEDALQRPGVSRDQITLLPADTLDAFFTNSEVRRGAPDDGWRPILEQDDRIVLAAPMPDGKTWYYATFSRRGNSWSVAGWGANEPTATPAQRGSGLRLEWRGDIVYDRHTLDPGIWLVNDMDETWVDDRGEYWAIVHLFDPTTGQEIPVHGFIAGVGLTYSVASGDAVELPLALGDLSSVPDGRYEAIACVPELALASPLGTVELVPRAPAPS